MAFPAIARTVQVFRRWDATRRWITSLKILEKFTVSDSSSFVGTQLGKAEKDICTFTTFDWLDRVNRNAFFYSMKALYALHRRHFCHTAAHECLTIRVNLASRLSWEIASCSQKCSNTRKNLLSICCSCHIENSEIPLSSRLDLFAMIILAKFPLNLRCIYTFPNRLRTLRYNYESRFYSCSTSTHFVVNEILKRFT